MHSVKRLVAGFLPARPPRGHAPAQVPSSIAWHPRGDALLIAGDGGSLGLWERALPAGMPSPWAAPDEVLRDADAAAAGESSLWRGLLCA